MGLQWNPDFIRTPPGFAMLGQTLFSIVGAICCIITFVWATGFFAFTFWSSFFISGALTLAHVCNLAQSIEAKFPYFAKVQLFYVGIWTGLYLLCSILSFINIIAFAPAYVSVPQMCILQFMHMHCRYFCGSVWSVSWSTVTTSL